MPKLVGRTAPTLADCPTVLGIDPGRGGGIAAIHYPESIVEVLPMPEDPVDLWRFLSRFNHNRRAIAAVELVGGWVGGHGRGDGDDGTTSNPGSAMFVFGKNAGVIEGMLVAAGISRDEVRPQAWQAALGIETKRSGESTTAWKNRLKALAQQLFPTIKVTKKVSDALLLAEWCRRKYCG